MRFFSLVLFLTLVMSSFGSPRALADSTKRLFATRKYQLCLIQMQRERDVKGRALLDRSYQHNLSIHSKVYALLASSLRILERSIPRNVVSAAAYEGIPDSLLEHLGSRPALYNLSQAFLSLRSEIRHYFLELGLDPADPILQKPVISRNDVKSISARLKYAPSGSPEWQLGIPFFLSPAIRLGDELLLGLENVIVPAEEGLVLHPKVYSDPKTTISSLEQARKRLVEGLVSMEDDLRAWTTWGKGEPSDCGEDLEEIRALESKT